MEQPRQTAADAEDQDRKQQDDDDHPNWTRGFARSPIAQCRTLPGKIFTSAIPPRTTATIAVGRASADPRIVVFRPILPASLPTPWP
ncbi:hypothetical protein [Kribbella koreensis]|uniref:hypothetical protein n=1 Tax=Kribbella koreensis TaxID=57909 RepID=UPI0031E3991C